jgi:multicomponent Na+:H+ antiporter subunit D
MTEVWLHPAWLLILGALLLPLTPARFKRGFLMIVPVLTLLRIGLMPKGTFGEVPFLDWVLVFGRVDALAHVFAVIMGLMAVIATLYSLHVRDDAQHMAAWIYAGGSLGAIYAGDLLTLFVFWEVMALSSVFLIWFRRGPQSPAAGFRYLLVHMAGGVALLTGIVLHLQATGSLAFVAFEVKQMTPAAWLILTGFLLNAAVPPLHAWLPDAYGEATFNGSVFLCSFTTKTAVYTLCRGFPGLELLVPLGVVMALYGVVYAVLENDSRRLLAYHIVSQVGYMVTGVGIGTDLAINGACAHAFANVLYKGLLFMGCGAVLHMTGQSKFTELGGLWQKMPWTFALTLIGGLAISAFPLTSGFVSKPMIVAAAYADHRLGVGLLLMLASVGTFLHTGLKVPYFIWFGKRNCSESTWRRAGEPPGNMLAAMTIAAVLCLVIGCYTPSLYALLPRAGAYYQPYTAYHISETLQLLLFTALGFFLLRKQLQPEPTISLDLDWFHRMLGRGVAWFAHRLAQRADNRWGELYRRAGLTPLARSADQVRRFDQGVIDGAVDGLATVVGRLGGRMRSMQRADLQQNLTLALAAVGIVLFLVYRFLV